MRPCKCYLGIPCFRQDILGFGMIVELADEVCSGVLVQYPALFMVNLEFGTWKTHFHSQEDKPIFLAMSDVVERAK